MYSCTADHIYNGKIIVLEYINWTVSIGSILRVPSCVTCSASSLSRNAHSTQNPPEVLVNLFLDTFPPMLLQKVLDTETIIFSIFVDTNDLN